MEISQSLRKQVAEHVTERDEIVPAGKWQFDAGVTAAFSDMLERSIPLYPEMRAACQKLAEQFAQDDTAVVDLGCSRGDAMAPLVAAQTPNRFVGVEMSPPMVDVCRQRFAREIERGQVEIHQRDLRRWYPLHEASVTLCVLTMQFLPVSYRQAIIANCWRRTAPGGCLLLVEKVLGAGAGIDEALVSQYHDMKRQHGYSEEQIDRKALALEGVLVPYSAAQNEQLLRGGGFDEVDCFYRYWNFAGWLAVKRKA